MQDGIGTGIDYAVRLLRELDMGYNTAAFCFFLPVFLGIYFAIRSQNIKRKWILLGNLVFYIWSGWTAALIVGATAGIAYWATREISAVYAGFEAEKGTLSSKMQASVLADYKKRARRYLYAAMFLILGIWIAVKVSRLAGLATVKTFSEIISEKGIIVPLGISYYSLSVIGYVLDVYWRKAKPELNFGNLFTVMTYFPHIVQGPISKYDMLLKQFRNLPGFEYERVCFGLQLMLWGYIKKMVIADRLAVYTSAVFDMPVNFAGVEILLAVILCVLQLYADFSGCMDIVGGISQAMGIQLSKNFSQPFFARSAQEFWARWHITLGAWTKEYIYLPIAMNPKFIRMTNKLKKEKKVWLSSFLKAFCPLVAVWLFTGLWHGTGIDYIVWGAYWCVLMTLSKEIKPLMNKLIAILHIDPETIYFRIFQSVRTYLLFAIGRMFTVAGSLAGCGMLWQRLFEESRPQVLVDGSLFTHGLNQKDFSIILVGIMIMMAVDLLHERGIHIREKIQKRQIVIRWCVFYCAMFALIILGMYGPDFDAASFVYGTF